MKAYIPKPLELVRTRFFPPQPPFAGTSPSSAGKAVSVVKDASSTSTSPTAPVLTRESSTVTTTTSSTSVGSVASDDGEDDRDACEDSASPTSSSATAASTGNQSNQPRLSSTPPPKSSNAYALEERDVKNPPTSDSGSVASTGAMSAADANLRLYIEDPTELSNNVCKSTFRMGEIRAAFHDIYLLLLQRVQKVSDTPDKTVPAPVSILGEIVRIDPAVTAEREKLRADWIALTAAAAASSRTSQGTQTNTGNSRDGRGRNHHRKNQGQHHQSQGRQQNQYHHQRQQRSSSASPKGATHIPSFASAVSVSHNLEQHQPRQRPSNEDTSAGSGKHRVRRHSSPSRNVVASAAHAPRPHPIATSTFKSATGGSGTINYASVAAGLAKNQQQKSVKNTDVKAPPTSAPVSSASSEKVNPVPPKSAPVVAEASGYRVRANTPVASMVTAASVVASGTSGKAGQIQNYTEKNGGSASLPVNNQHHGNSNHTGKRKPKSSSSGKSPSTAGASTSHSPGSAGIVVGMQKLKY